MIRSILAVMSFIFLMGCASSSLKTPSYSFEEIKQEEIHQLNLSSGRNS